MAIIYTYPVKTTPANDDLILISDSADSNKTKQVKVSSLPGGESSGVTQIIAGTNVTIDPVSGVGSVTINSSGGGGTPATPLNSVQFNNNSAFGGSADLTFTANTLAVKHTIDVKGQGSNNPAGRLKLNCEENAHALTLEGPAHSGGADYTLKFPSAAPGSTQILQSDNAGQLSWINTPSPGSGNVGQVTAGGVIPASSGAPLIITPTTGNVVATSARYAGGSNEGHVPLGGSNTTFLRGDATWVTPTNTTYDIMGSGNSYAAGLVLTGNATHGNQFLRKDGTWQTVTSGSNIYSADGALAGNRTITIEGYNLYFDPTSSTGGVVVGAGSRTSSNPMMEVVGNNQTELLINATNGNPDIGFAVSGAQKGGIRTNSTSLELLSGGTTVALTLDSNQHATFAGNISKASALTIGTSTGNSDILLDPNPSGSGVVVLTGGVGRGAGQIKFNCDQNSHGITLKGPPHAANASYTLTLPDDTGNANELLKTDGNGGLSWVAGASAPTSGIWYATLANSSGQSYASQNTQAQITITTNNCQWYRIGEMMYYQFYIAGTVKSNGALLGDLFLARSASAGAGSVTTYGLPTASTYTPTIVDDGLCNGSLTITTSESPEQPLTWAYPINGGRVGRDTSLPGYVQLFSLFGSGSTNKVYYPLSNQTWVSGGEGGGNWALGGTINALVTHAS